MNTVDSFETLASARKLPMLRAFELDCSAILGDISYLLLNPIVRRSRFTTDAVTSDCVKHHRFGRLLSDIVKVGEKQAELSNVESAAVDAMWAMTLQSEKDLGDGVTELIEANQDPYVPKLSSRVMRLAGLFQTEPSEQSSNMWAHVIADLMEKLDYPVVHLFPTGATEDLKRLDAIFRRANGKKS